MEELVQAQLNQDPKPPIEGDWMWLVLPRLSPKPNTTPKANVFFTYQPSDHFCGALVSWWFSFS